MRALIGGYSDRITLLDCIWNDLLSVSRMRDSVRVFCSLRPDVLFKILPPRDGATVSTSEFDALLERLRAKKPEGQKQPTLKTEPRNSNGILQPS